MHNLPLMLGKETKVAYLVVMTYAGKVINHYPKIYKRRGDATKRRDHLNKLAGDSGYIYKLFCAKGWYQDDDNTAADLTSEGAIHGAK